MSSIIKASAIKALDKTTRRLLTKTNRPKQPRSPCNFYTMEKFKEGQFKGTVAENSHKTRQIFEAYKALNDRERQRYIDEAEKDKIRFKNEFNQWYSTIQNNDQYKEDLIQVANALKEKYRRLGHL